MSKDSLLPLIRYNCLANPFDHWAWLFHCLGALPGDQNDIPAFDEAFSLDSSQGQVRRHHACRVLCMDIIYLLDVLVQSLVGALLPTTLWY